MLKKLVILTATVLTSCSARPALANPDNNYQQCLEAIDGTITLMESKLYADARDYYFENVSTFCNTNSVIYSSEKAENHRRKMFILDTRKTIVSVLQEVL